MVEVRQSTVIDAPVEDVWRVLRDFNGHDRWHPAIAASAIEAGAPVDMVGAVGGSGWPMAASCASNCCRFPTKSTR